MLQQGSIVWAELDDPQGRNPKQRPAIVLTPTSEISPDCELVLVAVTSTFDEPLPDNVVELPWDNNRHQVTKLRKRCIAVCDWLAIVKFEDILEVAGRTPDKQLHEILSIIPQEEKENDSENAPGD